MTRRVVRRFGLNPFVGCGKVGGPLPVEISPMNATFSKGPLLVGCAWGVVTGFTPFFQPIEPAARWALGLGLGLTYATVGLLVALLPDFHLPGGRRWLQGGLTGLLYSVPGAVFTMAPYPLREDAPRYWKEFAAGGVRAFCLTLCFGAVVGATCGLARKAHIASQVG